MINYRRFKSDDAEQVFEVAMKSWKETYKNIFSPDFINQFVKRAYHPTALPVAVPLMKKGLTEFYVAEKKDIIIGFAQIGYSIHTLEKDDPKNEIMLYRIYIDPEFLGQKVGSKLLSYMEKWVRKQSKTEYSCYCHENNEIGKQFYFHKNFKHIPKRDNTKENEIFLLKQLN